MSFQGFSVAWLFGSCVALIWLIYVLQRGTIRRPHPFHFAFGGFIALNGMSLLWSIDPGATLRQLIRLVSIGGLVYICWDLVRTHNEFNVLLQSFVAGTFVVLVIIIMTYFPDGATSRTDVAHGVNINSLARMIVFSLPPAAYLFVSSDAFSGHWARIVNGTHLTLGVFSLLLIGSRQGFVVLAALLGLATVAYAFRAAVIPISRWLAPLAVTVLGASVAILATVTPNNIALDRITTLPSAIATGGGRVEIWMRAAEVFKTTPILGTGGGTFGAATQIHSYAHNALVGIAVELGVIGVLGGVIILATVAHETVINRDAIGVVFATAIWLSLGLLSLVATLYYQPVVWLLLTILILPGHFSTAEKWHIPLQQADSGRYHQF